jgi:hypothetical protein
LAHIGPNGPNFGRILAKKCHFQGFWPFFLAIFGQIQKWPIGQKWQIENGIQLYNFWPFFFFFSATFFFAKFDFWGIEFHQKTKPSNLAEIG